MTNESTSNSSAAAPNNCSATLSCGECLCSTRKDPCGSCSSCAVKHKNEQQGHRKQESQKQQSNEVSEPTLTSLQTTIVSADRTTLKRPIDTETAVSRQLKRARPLEVQENETSAPLPKRTMKRKKFKSLLKSIQVKGCRVEKVEREREALKLGLGGGMFAKVAKI